MDFYRYLLVLLLVLPAVGAAIVAFLGPGRRPLIRQVCLGVTLLDALLACLVAYGFLQARGFVGSVGTAPPSAPGQIVTFRPEVVPGATDAAPHHTTWDLLDLGRNFGTPPLGQPVSIRPIQFFLGLDGINVWLVVLTTVLMVSSVLISWRSIEERVHEYYAWLLLLGTAMLGVFLSFDIILFYVFFELTLVPLFFLIGIWGGPERRHAARKFFIYTLTGSLITFLGIMIAIVAVYQKEDILTFSIPELVEMMQHALRGGDMEYWQPVQFWVFITMMVGFAVKVPLFPFHTWLPLAHVEAPTAGSVLLAGVLLKLGTYGLLRLTIPLAPDAAISIGLPLIGTLSVIGIIYGALCARAQDDIKKLVAYSSVSHLGFCTLGLFALNTAGLTGGLMQMINHGLSTGALFLIVGMLYDRYHTRLMGDYSGMASRLGLLSASMVFISLSSVGLPGLNGFIGEALVFFGMYDTNPSMAVLGTAGIVLGAWYLITMLRSVFFGPLKEPGVHGEPHGEHASVPIPDLSRREKILLAPILVLCLVLGVYPQPVLDTMEPDIAVVARIVESRPQPAETTETATAPASEARAQAAP